LQLLLQPAAILAHRACGVVRHTNPHVAWLLPLTSMVAQVVVFVFQAQPLVLSLNCGAKAAVAVAAVVAESDHTVVKAAHTGGSLVQPAATTGSCVLVFAIAIVPLAPYAAAQWVSMPEFASVTAA
jgi:hypothetical protein